MFTKVGSSKKPNPENGPPLSGCGVQVIRGIGGGNKKTHRQTNDLMLFLSYRR
jgi:hypothetical protein